MSAKPRVAEQEPLFLPRAGAASRTGWVWIRLLTVKDYKPNFTKFENVMKLQSSQSRMLKCDFPFNFQSARTQNVLCVNFFWLTPLILGRSLSRSSREKRSRSRKKGLLQNCGHILMGPGLWSCGQSNFCQVEASAEMIHTKTLQI